VKTRSQTTIATIFEAAERLFVARSYADVTMGDIAEACGLTKGALYHHFKSKEELYMAMMLTDMEEKRSIFSEAADFEGSCPERLRELTRTFLTLPANKQALIQLVRRDANIFDGTTREKLIRAYQRALPEVIETIIADGVRDGDLAPTDPRLLTWHYIALVEVTLSRHAELVLSHVDARLDHVLDLFFHGAAMAHKEAVE
jgi:AcrR family transcriptional regulator